MSANAPAGWYPQPDGTERWWDGLAWTAHSRPIPPPPQVTGHSGGRYGADGAAWTPVVARPYVAAKSPAVALLASFFIPGLGTILNGEVGKGVAILVGSVACWFLAVLLLPILVAVGLWVWGMVDAYQGAQRWNRAHGIIG